jgi:hypothetical protein
MSIKAKFARTYRASKGLQKGKLVRVYLVSASTPQELEEYEESQGDYLQHDEDTGKPLWKTTDAFIPSSVTLEWNYDKSRVYAKFDTVAKMQSAIDSLGTGLLAQATAQLAAQQLMASLGLSTTVAAPVATPDSVPQQASPSTVTPQEEPVAEGETPFTDESDE